MDSMRSLNTSLPSTSTSFPSRRQRRQRSQQPPEHLLQTFKAAALSVTNLYKAAASEHDKVYREGYQDALEELLSFLDKENLGLQDGEGWRVRQWATERFEGVPNGGGAGSGESEDEGEDDNAAKQTRETSPTLRRKASQELAPPPVAALRSSSSHTRSESAPPITAAPAPAEPTTTQQHTQQQRTASPSIQTYTIPQADFTFQSSHQYPHEMDMDDTTATDNAGTVHINVHPPRRGVPRVARTKSALGHGAGVKRRMPTFDFFDLGGLEGKDGFGGAGGGGGGGGGKRGRFT